MSEVFVSYGRRDEPLAKRIVESLRERGHRVWRNEELPAHRPYVDVIAEPLNAAKAVVVLWYMSGETEQEYFSDGISENITTDLSKVSALAVTARNTAFTFKGQSVKVRDIAMSNARRCFKRASIATASAKASKQCDLRWRSR